MPLITCPDCSNPVSDASPSCPKCGKPLTSETIQQIRSQQERQDNHRMSARAEAKKATSKTLYSYSVIGLWIMGILSCFAIAVIINSSSAIRDEDEYARKEMAIRQRFYAEESNLEQQRENASGSDMEVFAKVSDAQDKLNALAEKENETIAQEIGLRFRPQRDPRDVRNGGIVFLFVTAALFVLSIVGVIALKPHHGRRSQVNDWSYG